MCNEVSLSSVDFDEYYRSTFSPTTQSAGNFHEAVFSRGNEFHRFTKNATLHTSRSEIEQRTQKVSSNNDIASMGTVSGGAGLSYEWGGDKGGSVSGYVNGSASDDNGNKAEVEVQVNNDGSGSVNVSVSHNEESNG